MVSLNGFNINVQEYRENSRRTKDGLAFIPAIFDLKIPSYVGIIVEAPSGKTVGWMEPYGRYASLETAEKYIEAVVSVYDSILTKEQRKEFQNRISLH